MQRHKTVTDSGSGNISEKLFVNEKHFKYVCVNNIFTTFLNLGQMISSIFFKFILSCQKVSSFKNS